MNWRPLAFAGVAAAALGCDALFTGAPDGGDLFDAPLEGLTGEEMAIFVEGDGQFAKPFSAAEGLGPIFNNVSCAACHSGDGRGRPENTLVRFSIGADPALHMGGPQVQDRAIAGAYPEVLPAGVDVSHRLPPPVFGVGLIEAIPDSAILSRVDSLDADGDGVSGRPNWVTAPAFVPEYEPGGGAGRKLGRFSRKAQIASLMHQTVGAYHEDMGISTDFLPEELEHPQAGLAGTGYDRVSDPELPASVVRTVVNYLRMLAPPAPGELTAQRARGQFLFDSIGCASCHTPVMRTGPSTIAALANRDVALYSDLLLHDMGPGLADYRPDGDASGTEWRTAPLWGLRLVEKFLNGQAFYLHDGRAHSLEQALLLHGGEAQGARDRFAALPPADRTALLDFTGSR